MARQRAEYGRGEHVIEIEGHVDPGELAERLRATFRSPGYRPPVLPAAALELVRLSNQPDVTFKQVQAILERDALITGRVLQVAQSPLYNTSGTQLSLQQALMRLGLGTLTQLFLETTMNMRVFRAPGYDAPMNILRRHTTATAHYARAVCRHAAFAEEYAFLCGLLHDCGVAAALMVIGDVKRGTTPPPFEDVLPAVLEIHEEIGGMLCKLWKLPTDVELVVTHHHSCTVDGHVHPLTAAIAVAEGLAAQAGFGMDGDTQPDLPQVAVSALRITDKMLGLIRADAKLALERIQ
jgi:HD-like signal output (HDOD) protein